MQLPLSLTATTFTILSTLPSTLAVDWAISAFYANDCDIATNFYAYESDNAGSFQCRPFSGTAQSVNWDGYGFWCVDLHQNADCSGSSVHLESGVSGCQSGSWQSYTLSIPDDGYPC